MEPHHKAAQCPVPAAADAAVKTTAAAAAHSSTNQPTNQLLKPAPPACQSVSQPASQPVSQPISQPKLFLLGWILTTTTAIHQFNLSLLSLTLEIKGWIQQLEQFNFPEVDHAIIVYFSCWMALGSIKQGRKKKIKRRKKR